MDIIVIGFACYIAGALSSEGVRRTARKLSGGTFFAKKPPKKGPPPLTA